MGVVLVLTKIIHAQKLQTRKKVHFLGRQVAGQARICACEECGAGFGARALQLPRGELVCAAPLELGLRSPFLAQPLCAVSSRSYPKLCGRY